MEKKFQALRVIATLFKVLAVIIVIAAIIAAVAGVVSFAVSHRGLGLSRLGLFSGINFLIGGLISGLFLYGFGELIYLLLAIEENTRAYRLPPGPPQNQQS
ncbi:hypothetical protein BECAL_03101 [Bellilinea caldifistulae]|uniref:Uncharacterized protein n=1 Tax=Bellilinea caldifistulae TaxID=360411 RepID=A0A0P6X471_9CHLR|nr:hypothetical protein [Bellilinea caldifistulae]KPL76247.1 hypothetical protein AC812_06060 [Bellilinea caldifistulae]GAP11905.1 hypothetical protein BECAL_03101 [Bellilinea caldifistulae]